MKRSEFLNACQLCAMQSDIGVGGVLQNVPDSCILKYKGNLYYPMEYSIGFDRNGNAQHRVTLHDLFAKSIITVRLSEVEF